MNSLSSSLAVCCCFFFCGVPAHTVSAEGTISSGCAGPMGCVLDLLGCLGRWFVSDSLHIKATIHSFAGFPSTILHCSGMMNVNNFTCQCFIAVADLCLQNIWINRIHQCVFIISFVFQSLVITRKAIPFTMYRAAVLLCLLQCSLRQLY